MSELTREQVEFFKKTGMFNAIHYMKPEDFTNLCDLALRALTLPPDRAELVKRLRAAGHDERLSTGALYLEVADVLSRPAITPERIQEIAMEEYFRWNNDRLHNGPVEVIVRAITRALEESR